MQLAHPLVQRQRELPAGERTRCSPAGVPQVLVLIRFGFLISRDPLSEHLAVATQAMAVFDEMAAAELAPDTWTYNTLLAVLSKGERRGEGEPPGCETQSPGGPQTGAHTSTSGPCLVRGGVWSDEGA